VGKEEKPEWYKGYVAENKKAPGRKVLNRFAYEVNKAQAVSDFKMMRKQ